MGESGPKFLDSTDVAILMALWQNLYGSDDSSGRSHRRIGLTRDDLAAKLVGREAEKPLRTSAALYKHLAKIKGAPGLVRTSKGPTRSAGAPRDIYSLSESDIISWPTTARIVMEVWNAPGHHIDEERLIDKLASLQLRRDSDSPPIEKRDISMDIDYAISRKYLERFSRDLRAEQRLRFEIEYLSQVAAHCLSSSEDEETERGWR